MDSAGIELLLNYINKGKVIPIEIELAEYKEHGTETVGIRSLLKGLDSDEGKGIIQPVEELVYKDRSKIYQKEREEYERLGLASRKSLDYYTERDALIREVSYILQNNRKDLTVSQLKDIQEMLQQ